MLPNKVITSQFIVSYFNALKWVDYTQNAEDKLMCYSQEALDPETIRGQACLLI